MPRRDRDYAAEYRRRQELARLKGYRSYGQQRYIKQRSADRGFGPFLGIPPSVTEVDVDESDQLAMWTFKYTIRFRDGNGRAQYRSYIRRSNRSQDPSQFYPNVIAVLQRDYDVQEIDDIRVIVYHAA